MVTVAPVKKRLLALLIDYLIILAYALCLLGVMLIIYHGFFDGVPQVNSQAAQLGFHALGFACLTVPAGVYLYATESGPTHATFGKRFAKLTVKSKDGGVVSNSQVAVRVIAKLLPWEFAHTFVYQLIYYSRDGSALPAWVMFGIILANLIPLGYAVVVLCRKDRRAPHDLVAGTIVARV